MIDGSMNISVTNHLVVFATIIEEDVHVTAFLGLLKIESGKNATVHFYVLVNHLKIWKLDLCKSVAFANDGANTMVSSYGQATTKLQKNINSFFLSCHCIAYMTNLTAFYTFKTLD